VRPLRTVLHACLVKIVSSRLAYVGLGMAIAYTLALPPNRAYTYAEDTPDAHSGTHEAAATEGETSETPLPPLAPLVCPNSDPALNLPAQDTQLFTRSAERQALLSAIDNSLDYLRTPGSVTAYQDYAVPGITHSRVRRSLQRFRTLVTQSESAEALQKAVAQEFDFYQSIGNDEAGTVAFTGYFEPTYRARSAPDATYRYPIYRKPPTLAEWDEPHPTRAELEGADGLQANSGELAGLELAWLPNRLEAFLIQVQGSARLEMENGNTLSVGYAGRTNYPYVSMGRALIDDGIIAEDDLTLPVLIKYFEQNPGALDSYLPRNNRFVFFKETDGAPATGSLGYPVTAGRSIATDKSLMPPGALALINFSLPQRSESGDIAPEPTSRFVLDQDTGGAIKGAGRVDLFVGTGTEAGEVAGLINNTGQLYYLLIKE